MNIPLHLVIFTLAFGAALIITIISYQRRSAAGSTSLILFGSILAGWALLNSFFSSNFSQNTPGLIGYPQFFATVLATFIFTFILEYSKRSDLLNQKSISFLSIEPLITFVLVLATPWVGLVLSGIRPAGLSFFRFSELWGMLNILYFNAIVLIAIYILIKTYFRSPLPYRLQSGIILAGVAFIVPSSLISVSSTNPLTASVLLLASFTLCGISITYALFSYRLLDIVPIPRDVVVERMGDGWMMLDMRNRIVDLNPAAESVIGLPREKVFGQPAENVLTDWTNIINKSDSSKELDVRGRITLQNMCRYLNLRISPLIDLRGNQFGRLVVWRDITDSKRVEEARQLARDEMFMLLHSISNAAGRAANIEEFLEDTIYQIVYSLKSQASVIFLVEENVNNTEPRRLTLSAQHGLSPELVDDLSSLTEQDPLIGEILNSDAPMIIPDSRIKSPITDSVLQDGFMSMVLMPIRVQHQILGIIALARNEDPTFCEDELARLNVVADEIATFIHSDRQRQLSIALAERQRLVRDLHDSTTQKLYGLLTLTEAAQAGIEMGSPEQLKPILSRIGETARQALKEMRLFLYELQPVDLERDGLVSILNQRLTAVEGRADVKARLLSDETISLPLDKEVALYFIAQEALNNVLKHAKAKSVTVRLNQTKSNVRLEIEDDGNGFSPKKGDGGMGMRNMKERASQVGGKLSITSIPGKGTKISATVSKDRQQKIHLRAGYQA
jgi:PAS domain S-box-containing protein